VQSAVLGANLINLFSPILLVEGFAEMGSARQELIASSIIHQLGGVYSIAGSDNGGVCRVRALSVLAH